MSDELRADAEFLLAYPDKARPPTVRRVAAAYLAEHPADDAEPVTGTWLFSLGFRPAWGHPYCFNANGIDVRCTADELALATRTDELWTHERPTRGHVRRLLLALGITPTPKG